MGANLISHIAAYGPAGVTTSVIDTTGADFLVVSASYYTPLGRPSISDSKNNTWTSLTFYEFSNDLGVVIFYCTPSSVGTGHTFSISGSQFGGLAAQAWSGMAQSSVFQVGTDSGFASAVSTSVQPGLISPTGPTLVISGLTFQNTDSNEADIDSGFTQTDGVGYNPGQFFGQGMAYLLQPSGSGINPTWSEATASGLTANIAAFVQSAAAPPSPSSISPTSADQGQTISNFTVNGSAFESGNATLSFSGSGITVNSYSVQTSSQIVASITISGSATVGARDVVVTNATSGLTGTLSGAFTVDSSAPTDVYSVPDCRNYGNFPNDSVDVNGTLTYTVPSVDSRKAGAPVDSRAAGAPIACGTYPQNSRAPGTYGPGE